MFMALDSRGDERLLIFSTFGGSKTGLGGRRHAERLVNEMIDEKLRNDMDRRHVERFAIQTPQHVPVKPSHW